VNEREYDIALRPDDPAADPTDPETLLDDIVVNDVTMFRAEDMGDWWWMCCFLKDDERLTFCVSKRGGRVIVRATELPNGFVYEHDLKENHVVITGTNPPAPLEPQ
jgi:hypothetical protein